MKWAEWCALFTGGSDSQKFCMCSVLPSILSSSLKSLLYKVQTGGVGKFSIFWFQLPMAFSLICHGNHMVTLPIGIGPVVCLCWQPWHGDSGYNVTLRGNSPKRAFFTHKRLQFLLLGPSHSMDISWTVAVAPLVDIIATAVMLWLLAEEIYWTHSKGFCKCHSCTQPHL